MGESLRGTVSRHRCDAVGGNEKELIRYLVRHALVVFNHLRANAIHSLRFVSEAKQDIAVGDAGYKRAPDMLSQALVQCRQQDSRCVVSVPRLKYDEIHPA